MPLPPTLAAETIPAFAPVKRTPVAVALALLQGMRPKQWVKNATVFLPLLFSINQYWRPSDFEQLLHHVALIAAAAMCFSAISSGEYLLNDLMDREADRLHPKKRFRPLASGRLQPAEAVAAAIVLIGGGLAAAYLLEPSFALVGLLYAVMMWAYTLWLKHQVILDVFVLAAGFVLRAMGGALVIGVPISPWLYLCTSLGALFLGLSKRRHELTLLEGGAASHRPILEQYSLKLVDEMVAVVTPSTLIAYSLYTFTAPGLPANHAMMFTIPFVLYGVFRYLYLVHNRSLGGSPEEVLLTDRPLLIDVLLWAAVAAGILIVYR